MKKCVYVSLLLLCSLVCVRAQNTEVLASDAARSAIDDDFFTALQEASEQEQEQPLSDAERAMDALTETQMKQQAEAAQEASCVQKYAMAALVKAMLCYGTCKSYVMGWIGYFTACLFGE